MGEKDKEGDHKETVETTCYKQLLKQNYHYHDNNNNNNNNNNNIPPSVLHRNLFLMLFSVRKNKSIKNTFVEASVNDT